MSATVPTTVKSESEIKIDHITNFYELNVYPQESAHENDNRFLFELEIIVAAFLLIASLSFALGYHRGRSTVEIREVRSCTCRNCTGRNK